MERRVERFPFFYSYYEAYETLTDDADKIRFIDAVMKYAFFGEEIDLPENLAGMFVLTKPNIEKSVKNAQIGKANGKKGGAPIGNQNACKTTLVCKTTPGLNENKVDKDKERDMEHGYYGKGNSISETAGGQNIDYEKIAGRS